MINKFVFVIALLSLLVGSPTTPSNPPMAVETPGDECQINHESDLDWNLIVLADNEPQTAETGDQQSIDNADQPSESGTTTTENSNKNSKNTERKPLRPFRPSEKIAAEQAVDFPVDI